MTQPFTLHKDTSRSQSSPETIAENPSNIRIDELVTSALSLLVVIPLLVFILSKRKLRMKKSFQLFVNLLLLHILFHITRFTSNFLPPTSEDVVVILNTCLLVSMFLGLMLLSMERVLLIMCPFTYRHFTTAHCIAVIVSSWLPMVVFLIVLLGIRATQETLTIITTSLIVIATVVLTFSNLLIYRAARSHYRFKRKMIRRPSEPKRMLKASYVCFAIVASFVLLWLPYLIHNIMALANVYQPSAHKLFTKFVEHFALLNAIVDAVLFIWISREMKRELRDTWNRMRGKDVPSRRCRADSSDSMRSNNGSFDGTSFSG